MSEVKRESHDSHYQSIHLPDDGISMSYEGKWGHSRCWGVCVVLTYGFSLQPDSGMRRVDCVKALFLVY